MLQVMAAPPLQAHNNNLRLWTNFQRESTVPAKKQREIGRSVKYSISHRRVLSSEDFEGASQAISSRRWVETTTHEVDELLISPSSPQVAFQDTPNDLISFSRPLSLGHLTLQQFTEKIQASTTVPFSAFVNSNASTKTNFTVPPNSPIWPQPAFNNYLYFQNNIQTDRLSNPNIKWPSKIQLSPDIAVFQPVKSDEVQKAMLGTVVQYMQKNRDSNLIDLISKEESLANQVLNGGLKKKNDILDLFDPLAVLTEIVPSPVSDPIPSKMQNSEEKDVLDRAYKRESIDHQLAETNNVTPHIPEKSAKLQKSIRKQKFRELKVTPRSVTVPLEIIHFAEAVRKLRRGYSYDDVQANVGRVMSPTLENNREDSLEVRIIVNFYSPTSNKYASFTCDVGTSIDLVINNSLYAIFGNFSKHVIDDFVLKVKGIMEYFSPNSSLRDYEYVHLCHKYGEPVYLTLVETTNLQYDLARTVSDDKRDVGFSPDELLEDEPCPTIQSDSVNILLETIHKEIDKLRQQAKVKGDLIHQLSGVVQAVKALCSTLSGIETIALNRSFNSLNLAVLNFTKYTLKSNSTVEESDFVDKLDDALLYMVKCLEELIDLYCQSFRVTFHVPKVRVDNGKCRDITSFTDKLLIHAGSLHQLPPDWTNTFQSIMFKTEVHHGTFTNSLVTSSRTFNVTKSFFHWVCFEEWINYETMSMCNLQREATVYFFIYGIKTMEMGLSNPQMLGWTAISVFDHQQKLRQGSFLLGLWPEDVSPKSGPAVSNHDCSAVILSITFPEYEFQIQFPHVISIEKQVSCDEKFEALDRRSQTKLLNVLGTDLTGLLAQEEKELLWEKRHFLKAHPQALPKLLLSVSGWDWACLFEIYSAIRDWHPLNPVESLVLLLPDFPDSEVRSKAISWIRSISSDELCDYIPQLVQALRFETWLNSSLVMFLLERAMTNVRLAHNLYWFLNHDVKDPLTGRRIRVVLNTLKIILGSAMREMFQRQGLLLGSLSAAAERVKTIKDSLRLSTLFQELDTTRYILEENATCLPLSPSLQVCSVDVKDCSYFTSNTLPLKILFNCSGPESHRFAAIYKVGDDLRQDMLTLQMIRIMDKLWLKEGLDLKIITFGCMATSYKEGVIEMVRNADTLRKIQTEHGLTGSFKDRPIAEWLQKHNTSELDYKHAVENFTLSCAGYCVATYVLGICDRHNDNIMLKTSGHMFHIDFGKFLGDSQMFGNIKRDRVPFVLTSDMAYVINGGDKPTKDFQTFIDVCCQAFNILRHRSTVLLNLFALMVESGVSGLNAETVMYVEKALLSYLSDAEASSYFTKQVEESLRSWSTQLNFFVHNLAQLRFTGDHGDESLLSFIPKTYTKESDGIIKTLAVTECQKRYDPEKYYVYKVRIEREDQNDAMFVYRSFPEFCEFHQKLCTLFPLAKFPPLPRDSLVSRTNVRYVAERRRTSLALFMQTILGMAQEIAHCPLLYTFLHPLLRDQEGIPQDLSKKPEDQLDASTPIPQRTVKISIVYKNNCLCVMIMHAKNLVFKQAVPPDTYIKTYLIPDPHKLTKKKTKVVVRNSHPTFMEMLMYKLPYEMVRRKKLSVSAWSHDRVQENGYLGATLIDLEDLELRTETSQWYPLDIHKQPI